MAEIRSSREAEVNRLDRQPEIAQWYRHLADLADDLVEVIRLNATFEQSLSTFCLKDVDAVSEIPLCFMKLALMRDEVHAESELCFVGVFGFRGSTFAVPEPAEQIRPR